MSEYQVEMRWRCSACGAENLGRHMVCQGCGDPKDDREPYVMPGDVSEAAQVTDPALLRLAHGGENWRCAYCESDQRALDGSCGRCGAGAKRGAGQGVEAAAPAAPQLTTRRRLGPFGVIALVALALVGLPVALVAVFMVFAVAKPHTAVVKEATWTRSLSVERRELVPRTAFTDAVPTDAVEIADAGVGVHHHDQIFDRFETEAYTVTVPDGTRSETYRERQACGKTCTSTPRSCTKSCTPNKNGFATCKDVCTGGGESCSTKYCDVTRTRQVPKTREDRRTRQVQKFRQEPRYAPQVAFRTWAWVPVFRTTRQGKADEPLAWPVAQIAPLADAGPAELREERSETFEVKLVDNFGSELVFTPKTPEELARFAVGRKFVVGRGAEGGPTFTDP
ncbi:MAG: hypothetical protein IPF92_23735 [Myxococcales bacterium]|nr:hypothetical protein [Myxococcales bacterium]